MHENKYFDEDLLLSYMQGFWGYGNFDADYWVIGMEEGGGDSFEEVQNRISTWREGGRKQLEDLREYHQKIGVTEWFEGKKKLQPTWNKMIRVVLASQGNEPTAEDVRDYQTERLGRTGGETCLIELMPLPSPSTSHWMYKDHSKLPELASRDVYLNTRGPVRLAGIKELISKHQPKYVVFYGLSYLEDWWRNISAVPLEAQVIDGKQCYIGLSNSTIFAATQHPVATGVRNTYFHRLGVELKKSVAGIHRVGMHNR